MILEVSSEMYGEIGIGFWETLYMTFGSAIIAYLIGLPVGVLLYMTAKDGITPNRALNIIVGVIVNILRPIPFVILAIFIRPFTRALIGTAQGTTAMLIPLIVSSAPYIARMVESSLKEVDKGKIEAAQAMGTSNLKIIYKVLIPEAKPSLIIGATIVLATILGYTAMAGVIAGGGLGDIALRYGYYRYQTEVMWITLIILIVIVQVIQEAGLILAKKLDNRIRK